MARSTDGVCLHLRTNGEHNQAEGVVVLSRRSHRIFFVPFLCRCSCSFPRYSTLICSAPFSFSSLALFSQRFISISANNKKNHIFSLSRLLKIWLLYFLANIIIHIFFLYIISTFYHILSLKKKDRNSSFFSYNWQ
jgi:hypothetical protein